MRPSKWQAFTVPYPGFPFNTSSSPHAHAFPLSTRAPGAQLDEVNKVHSEYQNKSYHVISVFIT